MFTPAPEQLNQPVQSAIKLLCVFMLCLSPGFSEGIPAENKQQQLIKTLAKEFLTHKAEENARQLNASHYRVTTKPLDKNIRLTSCKTPVQLVDLSQTEYGHQLLKAQCENNWEVLVTGMIHIYTPILVSNKKLPKRHKIQEPDIGWREVDISQLQDGFLTRPGDAISKYLQIAIQAGTPLNRNQLTSQLPPF